MKTTLVVMMIKRELYLTRSSKGDAGSVESLGIMQLTVDLWRRRDPGTQVTRLVEEEMVKEDFKASATTLASMGTRRLSAGPRKGTKWERRAKQPSS